MPAAGFHIMTKPIGPICNLDCKYCFYLEKENLYPNTRHWAMSPEVLERYIQQYIAAQPIDEVHFAWQGGEPTLLGVDFFRTVVALQQKYAGGKAIHNALQTNGTLIDDEWGQFLAEHNFLVGVSIDGPRELHDHYRVDKGNAPTFDRVMRGLRKLKEHKVEFNTLTVVNRHNSQYPLEVYRFLKEIGSGFMQFIPVVERKAAEPGADGLVLIQPSFDRAAEVTEWSVEPLAYGRFLAQIFDEWVKKDVGRYFVQQFDVALESWLGTGSEFVRISQDMRLGAGDGAYRRSLFLRSFRLPGKQARKCHGDGSGADGRLSAAEEIWPRQAGLPSAHVPRMRCPIRVQRGMPEASIPHNTGRRTRAELSVRRLQTLLSPH